MGFWRCGHSSIVLITVQKTALTRIARVTTIYYDSLFWGPSNRSFKITVLLSDQNFVKQKKKTDSVVFSARWLKELISFIFGLLCRFFVCEHIRNANGLCEKKCSCHEKFHYACVRMKIRAHQHIHHIAIHNNYFLLFRNSLHWHIACVALVGSFKHKNMPFFHFF